jgi:DNA-binding transcriptional MerR regulator
LNRENNYTFKEICDLTGYKASVVRYYEKEFKLDIPRDNNGRRFFSKKDLDRLMYIKQLQDGGYNNSQIKKILDTQDITLSEVAVTHDTTLAIPKGETLTTIEEKIDSISLVLNQLNENLYGKDKDLLISENMKLKMELKQKSFEIMELKEKLRYEKENNKGLLLNLFRRK